MADDRSLREFAVLDTSVVVDYRRLDSNLLPRFRAITTVTFAELHAGPNAARHDVPEEAVRMQRLHWAQQVFRNPLPFDEASARVFGTVNLLVLTSGRKPRTCTADLMIASIAIRNRLPLYTRNPKDFTPLESLLEVVAV
ncbi:hypothetical protein GCM10009830_27360 [Glycomyces endophyticus]|uniref:Type II toxin-antitoxin system VapC family toxin n=1 Tax=Glycomyces endophyticus TaxID=480996 RepID=A0ABN2GY55_9ACTN